MITKKFFILTMIIVFLIGVLVSVIILDTNISFENFYKKTGIIFYILIIAGLGLVALDEFLRKRKQIEK